jgi:hypothetical protein
MFVSPRCARAKSLAKPMMPHLDDDSTLRRVPPDERPFARALKPMREGSR